MTLIDKDEALAVLRKAQVASCTCQIKTPDPEWHSHNCRYRIIREAEAMIDHLPDAAIPARGVGVPTDADREWIDARADELFREAERRRGAVTLNTTRPQDFRDYFVVDATLERFAALAPTDAHHVNETPKNEHDGADVLTDAAQAREAALREAAATAEEHMDMHNGRDMNSYRAALGVHDAILALIWKG